MTSSHLRRHLEFELARLHASGRSALVEAFLELDHGGDFGRLEGYVVACRDLVRRAREAGADELAFVLRYLAFRTLAYPLDRPKEALGGLVELLAELSTGPGHHRHGLRSHVLHRLVELEVLRAFHKIDAPGHRDAIVAGARELWPRLGDDLGPQTEVLDVLWRTGYWCRDPALMREASRFAHGTAQALRFSAAYWSAREQALEGRHAEAVALLVELLEARREVDEAGETWRHYLAVELATNEAALGRVEPAKRRLEQVAAELGDVRDPMLAWDRARAKAAIARAERDDAAELAAWDEALAIVQGLGTDRLEAEFALELAKVARRCSAGSAGSAGGDGAAFARAKSALAATLPGLRSGGDLRAEAATIAGLCS